MQMADLGVVQIRVPVNRYVPGLGWAGREQYSAVKGEVIFKWPTTSPEDVGLHATLTYDMEVTFGDEAFNSLPNLFCLLNGLPVDEEVEIPDFGYEGRDFYVVGRKIVVVECDRAAGVAVIEHVVSQAVRAGGRDDLVLDYSPQATNEIDLRGMMGDEAVEKVGHFLDTAYVAGLHRVDIIHGKGTGALRKRISALLKTYPHVKSFRLGEWNEGGLGVTVVELSEA